MNRRLRNALVAAGSVVVLAGVPSSAWADLSVTKTGPGGVKPGEDLVYTIVVSNTGPGDLAGVVLDDPTPSGLSLPTVSGDCTLFPCTFATLVSGATRTVTAKFVVPPGYNGPNPIVNTAVAHTNSTDGVTATASTAVTRIAGFYTLPPCRIVDTRQTTGVPIGGPVLGKGETRTLDVREACGLPGNAYAISYNATVTEPTGAGNLRLFPGGSTAPGTSSINYGSGQTRANNGIVPVSADGRLSLFCDQASGTTHFILDVNGYFASADAVPTPAGQNVHVRPVPEVALTFDNVGTGGTTSVRVFEFADNRTGAIDQDLKLFFPAGSPERALLPSVVVPDFIKPLGKGGPGGSPTFVLTQIDTSAAFSRTVEFHGFEDFRLGWNPPCVDAQDPTQEPRTFYARDSTSSEPHLTEELGYSGQPVFVDISSGCGSNKGSGWNFSFYLTAKDTRTPHDIALYMLNNMQNALSVTFAGLISNTPVPVATQLGNEVTSALAALDTDPSAASTNMTNFIGIVDAHSTGVFDNSARNVSGELVGRALSVRYMLGKQATRLTEFPLPGGSAPIGIVAGPDGNLWFTAFGGNAIGRITPSGVSTSFLTMGRGPYGITSGPDGNLWYTGFTDGQIGRITPAGVVTEFPIPTPSSTPMGIAHGPDGNLWFAEGNRIGRITPAGTITEFPPVTLVSDDIRRIAAGPDGNLWFTEVSAGKIGRITPAGVVTEFPVPSQGLPYGITSGPDGNLWFTETFGLIGRITPAGVVTEFPLAAPANGQPWGIAAGPDGNLWFTENATGRIGRITPAGVITEFVLPDPGSCPDGIAAGPDGNLWFVEGCAGKIGRFTP